MRPALTPREAAFLEAWRAFHAEHGYAPSLSELAAVMRTSIGNTQQMLGRLRAKRYLLDRRGVANSRTLYEPDTPVASPTLDGMSDDGLTIRIELTGDAPQVIREIEAAIAHLRRVRDQIKGDVNP